MVDWIGDVKPIKNITITFNNPVYPDDEVIHKGKVKEIQETNSEKIIKCEYLVEKINGEMTARGKIMLSF